MSSSLHLLRPEWLWLLLALPVITWAWHLRRRRDNAWREVVDASLLPHLVDQRVPRSGIASLALQCIAWTLAAVAMAGPSWRTSAQASMGGGAPLVIALDLSDATLAGDLPPSRLLQARAKLAQLLRDRNGRPTALVAYAGDAFTVAPMTDDTANIALFLDALAPDIMPVPGNRPARAIEIATLLLSRAGHARGDVLLLTDHADGDAAATAARARGAGYRVSALAMGTGAGAAYRRADGSIVHAALDEASLSALATAGGGTVLQWHEDLRLPEMAGSHAGTGDSGVRTWRDEGYWLLLPLMLLTLFAFRRGAAVAVLALCMWLPLPQAYAREVGDGEGGLWRRADQVRHARMRDGVEAFRADDFDGALRAWEGIAGAEAAYNRGNALAKQGRFAEAIAAYDAALQAQPGMADAVANRNAVEAAMQRRPPAGGGQSSGNSGDRRANGQSQPGAGKGEAGAGNDGQEADGSAGAEDAQRQGSGNADTSRAQQRQQQAPLADSASAPDAGAQRAADDAQRERMQRAMQQQGTRRDGRQQAGDGQRVEGRPERAESAAEREKRQANEAWLRRIPDDPGGVLRARFKLEHERRSGRGGTP